MNRALWIIAALALTLAVAGVLMKVLTVLLVIFAGTLLGLLLANMSEWLEQRSPLSYHWAFALWLVLLLIVLLGGAYFVGSRVVEQAVQLSDELRAATLHLMERLQQSGWAPNGDELKKKLGDVPMDAMISWADNLSGSFQNVSLFVATVLLFFFVGVYTAARPDLYLDGVLKLVPTRHKEQAENVIQQLRSALTGWLIGRLFSMAVIGVATAIGLWAFGVPLPITLGVVAGLLTFIPNLGPILAAIPQALLALKVGTATVVYVIAFNLILQAVESQLLTPIVQRYKATLPPAVMLSVQLLFAVSVGIVGIMMAAPLTVAVMVLVQMLYIRDRLGDPSPGKLATSD